MDRFEPVFLWVIAAIAAFFCVMIVLLAMVAWLHARNQRLGRRWTALEKAWEDSVLGYLTGDVAAGDVLAKVPDRDGLFFLQYLWRYHKTLAGGERRLIADLAAPFLPLLRPRLSDRMPEVRARAVTTLGALGGEEQVPFLKAALNDASDLVAMQAAWALAKRGDPANLPDILARLGRYGFWDPEFLVSMLSSMGQEAAPPVRAIFADSSRPAPERALAAAVLRKLRDYPSAAAALAACGSETDPALLRASLDLLADVGGPEALPAVERHCLSGDASVRTRALRALGRLGGESGWMLLVAAMGDASPRVRLEAGAALLQSGGRKILGEISISKDPRAPAARQILELAP